VLNDIGSVERTAILCAVGRFMSGLSLKKPAEERFRPMNSKLSPQIPIQFLKNSLNGGPLRTIYLRRVEF
jgi:hypothetical protein